MLDVVECEKCFLSCYLHSTTEILLRCARDILQIPIMSGADDYVAKVRQQQLLQWKDKALHSEFLRKVDSGGAFSLSFQWLMYGQLKIPTKAQVVAAQDQAFTVKAIQNCIM